MTTHETHPFDGTDHRRTRHRCGAETTAETTRTVCPLCCGSGEVSRLGTFDTVSRAALQSLDLTSRLLKSKCRTAPLANRKHLAAYLIRLFTRASYQEIADLFCRREHGTIINSVKRAKNLIDTESKMKALFEHGARSIRRAIYDDALLFCGLEAPDTASRAESAPAECAVLKKDSYDPPL